MEDTSKTKDEYVKEILDAARQGNTAELEKKVRALAASEELHRSLIENCLIGIYRSTPEGRILFANRTIMEMFEYNTFRDYKKIDLVREAYDAGYPRREFLEEIEFKGVVKGLEVTIVTRNGTRFNVRENSRAVRNAAGKTLYYEGTMEDISEGHHKD